MTTKTVWKVVKSTRNPSVFRSLTDDRALNTTPRGHRACAYRVGKLTQAPPAQGWRGMGNGALFCFKTRRDTIAFSRFEELHPGNYTVLRGWARGIATPNEIAARNMGLPPGTVFAADFMPICVENR